MITDIRKLSILLACVLGFWACAPESEITPTPIEDNVVAFPGADGGGKYTVGGRGTAVYVVSSLEDDPTDVKIGTLRYALAAKGRRIVIFSISGRIDLVSNIELKNGNVTILGQSAPGDGICISGSSLIVKSDNVIIRFMRFRMGDLKGREADVLTVEKGHKNILIDHCSCSWSTDECVSIYGVENATLQYCIISESLNNSVHAKGAHGYGGIWGGKNTTFHHNLLAHHKSRMPRFDHDYVTTTNVGPTDFVNNVVYNWRDNSAYGGESSKTSKNQRQYNFVANYYKPGPVTKSGVKKRLLNPTTKCGNCGSSITPGKFYMAGNTMDGASDVTTDNWSGVFPDDASKKDLCKVTTRFKLTTPMSKEETAAQAYETVLAKAGCSLHRDTIDARIVDEVREGKFTYEGSNTDADVKEKSVRGLIDTPDDVGGWPEYKTYDVPTDTDRDGIPDAWEEANGLDPNSALDARQATLEPPYINLEVYLNSLVVHLY